MLNHFGDILHVTKNHEIKKISRLKRQVWINDDEFDHIVKNPQRVLRLNTQDENHPHFEEFTKQCKIIFVYGTYVLEGEADRKLSLGNIWDRDWNLFQEDPLPSNKFFSQMINCMKA